MTQKGEKLEMSQFAELTIAAAGRVAAALDWVVGRFWIDAVGSGIELLVPTSATDGFAKRMTAVAIVTVLAHGVQVALQHATQKAVVTPSGVVDRRRAEELLRPRA